MKILNFDKSEAKIGVENPDDLWHLSQLIDSGDTVKGRTYRKVKIGEEGDRNQKVVKKPVTLSLSVERVEFHADGNALRVSGKIVEGPDDIPRGSYHTLNVEVGTTISLLKDEWLSYQKERLKEASQEHSPDVLICVMDRDEAHFALLTRSGYRLLGSISGDVQRKATPEEKGSDFYGAMEKVLKEYAQRHHLKKIVLASPAFWKEEFMKAVKDTDLKNMVILASCSSSDKTAINEVLKRPEIQQALHEDRMHDELRIVEQLLVEISKQGSAAYGLIEVKRAVDAGAVLELLVTEGFIRKKRAADDFAQTDAIMRSADKLGAKIRIIGSAHDGGKKLDGLGGIAALLRYKLTY